MDLKTSIDNIRSNKRIFFDIDLKKLRSDKSIVETLCKGMDSDLKQIESWAQ